MQMDRHVHSYPDPLVCILLDDPTNLTFFMFFFLNCSLSLESTIEAYNKLYPHLVKNHSYL